MGFAGTFSVAIRPLVIRLHSELLLGARVAPV